MQSSSRVVFLLLVTLSLSSISSTAAFKDSGSDALTSGNSPITKVVKMLQEMAAKSQADGEKEAKTFEKFKCFCDKTLAENTKTSEGLQSEISFLENNILKLKALGSALAQKKVKTAADLKAKGLAEDQAVATRKKSHEAFLTEESDLTKSLESLNQAIDTLGLVGGEESEAAKLLQTGSSSSAPSAVGFLARAQKALSGSKVPDSGVHGVLVSTRDTYVKNLDALRNTEATEVKSHDSVLKTLENSKVTLTVQLDEAISGLGSTEEELGLKTKQLQEAKRTLGETESAVAELKQTCAQKTKVNEERRLMRAEEDAAIAKAVSVLNSDEAFAKFGKAYAFLQFLQMATVRRHISERSDRSDMGRSQVLELLSKVAREEHSVRIAAVAAAVAGGNPFDKVITEMQTMQGQITKEAAADTKKLAQCTKDLATNQENIDAKTTEIDELNSAISDLEKTLESPAEGLKISLAECQKRLKENGEEQSEETGTRKEENVEYQTSSKNLAEASTMISRALVVLKNYYSSVALMQRAVVLASKSLKASSSDMPETEDGPYEGQSESGAKVLGLLEGLLKETQGEEQSLHKTEQEAQAQFEDSMKSLVEEQDSLNLQLSETQKAIADAELELENKKEQLLSATGEKTSLEDYREKAKPGCDYITANFEKREASRVKESKALASATETIKASPAYKQYTGEAALA
eukprot:TRINITY_DN93494_c0_g1_i1.p1 TRINITY_DN93494_c0_g1~~TRINITY_DN93494_c0_g1_i1.p1  ORF type:complete len:695 (-),score=203.72 TRINITY_DN93494_c0_g1_i1:203-2287(-)